jgi:nucleotide-binding universal stress UspA family protein/hemerythrin-like domain-containing protein
MYRHLLVPIDGSTLSAETISNAVEFARDAKARITFFHATPDYLATGDGALTRSVSPKLATELAAGEAHAILSKAAAAARAVGVEWQALYKPSDRPYEAILEAAMEQGCDLIFTSSRGPKSIGGLMLGSETLKILMHASIPVLVSSVSKNSSTPDMSRAISVIKDEHRSLAAVLHGLKHVLNRAKNSEIAPDFALIKTMLFYITEFPEKLHHPKEDSYLFKNLRLRTHAVDDAIAQLCDEHANKSLLTRLEQAFALYASGAPDGGNSFERAFEQFAEAEWHHMSVEEESILPAAKQHLLPEDWAEIAEAFGKNGDPRFCADRDKPFHDMFVRIARLAQPVLEGET